MGKKAKALTIGGGAIIAFIFIVILFLIIKSINFSSIFFSFGKNLYTDEYGQTNILLVGIGGEGHDGGDLTDTLIVASIDYENELISMISIPRDLYIKSEDLKTSDRINKIYYIAKNKYDTDPKALETLSKTLSDILGIRIEYYVKVDFGGFKKIVDSLDGVDIVVPKSIYDPEYPKDGTYFYETFSIEAGPEHLDGETALKYARTRKTSSDFERSERQQQLLSAIKEKALELNILTDAGKIKKLYSSIQESMITNLEIKEIIELAKIGKKFDRENILSFGLSNDPINCGGFLYTPSRELFGGAYVLLPAGNKYDFIHEYIKNVFKNPKLIKEPSAIQVRNGTRTALIAEELHDHLNRLCLNSIYYSNAENRDLAESTIYYKTDAEGNKPLVLEFIQKILPIKMAEGIPEIYLNSERKSQANIVIELGKDYIEKFRINNPYKSLKYTTPPATPTETGSPGPETPAI